jgi:hypothetical protein
LPDIKNATNLTTQSLDDRYLSTRLKNALRRSSIYTVQDVITAIINNYNTKLYEYNRYVFCNDIGKVTIKELITVYPEILQGLSKQRSISYSL